MADLEALETIAQAGVDEYLNDTDRYELSRPGDTPWTFEWSSTLSILGRCQYSKRKIQLSKPWMQVLSDDEALDILFHELAHGVNFLSGTNDGHGPNFKAICRELGCEGGCRANNIVDHDRKYEQAKRIAGKVTKYRWQFRCSCGFHQSRQRKPKYAGKASYMCPKCKQALELLNMNV